MRSLNNQTSFQLGLMYLYFSPVGLKILNLVVEQTAESPAACTSIMMIIVMMVVLMVALTFFMVMSRPE